MLPKVNAGAEPVVGIEAGEELLPAQQHGISNAAITAVKGEDGAMVALEVHDVIGRGVRRRVGVGLPQIKTELRMRAGSCSMKNAGRNGPHFMVW